METSPYFIVGPAIIGFSGGRSSGYMLWKIKQAHGGVFPADVVVVFCNTGKEDEATLRFVHMVETEWDIPVVWLEFDPSAPRSTKVVDFVTASRAGEPLTLAIETRPTQHLFNAVSRYCTGTTKIRRKIAYARSLGWMKYTAISGIRADESHRADSLQRRNGLDGQTHRCPMVEAGDTKAEVFAFWASHPFDLELPIVEGETIAGNCDLCPLKAEWKIVEAIRENRSRAVYWIDHEDAMAVKCATIPRRCDGPDFRHQFRKNKSYRQLLAMADSGEPIKRRRKKGEVDCACTD